MKKINIKDIVMYASVAAIYVVLTWLFGSLSYGPIQFRISEVLVLLCFFNKKYFTSLTLGCLISNLMSPNSLDILFGTLATMISLFFICKSKNLFIASLYPVIFNGLIVALELTVFSGIYDWNLYLFYASTVALGEFVCVSIVGVILFTFLKGNKDFIKMINE